MMAFVVAIGAFCAAGWCGAQTKGAPEGHGGPFVASAFTLVAIGMFALMRAI